MEKKKHILVVDDEDDILELICYNLCRNGYRTTTATTGEVAIKQARASLPDLILLDLMLPGLDGLDVCRMLSNDPRTAGIPIVMVTARGEDADVVAGLELGATDYITKPFSPRVLLARVRAVLRKGAGGDGADAVIRRDNLVIDPRRREVWIGDQRIRLTRTEFDLLALLARHPGWVFGRNRIIEQIRGDDYPVTERSVDVQIVALRRKLKTLGERIETVHGVGYRFAE